MAIRKMELADYDDVQRLIYQIHEMHMKSRPDIYRDGNPLPIAYFERCISDANALNYAYEKNGSIIGAIMATKEKSRNIPINQERYVYFIEDIVVDKEYRKQGIGKELYLFLENRAREEDVDGIELNVWAFNEEALKFYESLGMSVKNMKLEQVLKKEAVNQKNLNILVTANVDN